MRIKKVEPISDYKLKMVLRHLKWVNLLQYCFLYNLVYISRVRLLKFWHENPFKKRPFSPEAGGVFSKGFHLFI